MGSLWELEPRGDPDHRGDADVASDASEVRSEGRYLASPLLPPCLPPITGEKWPMAKSKWKPVGQGAWEILFADTNQPCTPLHPMIKERQEEGQGIHVKVNRFPQPDPRSERLTTGPATILKSVIRMITIQTYRNMFVFGQSS